MKRNFLLALIFVSISISAQNLCGYETKMAHFFREIEQNSDSITAERYNDSISAMMNLALQVDNSFCYPFDSLKYVGKVLSDDGKLRIYTWNVPIGNRFRYNCFAQKNDGSFVKFQQADNALRPSETAKISAENWYGALYYRAILHKIGREKAYILIGWSSQNERTQTKLIDVLTFDQFGGIWLGTDIFDNARGTIHKRVLFEYDSEFTLHLDYEPQKRRIAFDHLSPAKYFGEDSVTFGPDFSVDAYVRKGKKWILKEDIRAKNR